MHTNRREILETMFGAGCAYGLRALATGLPISMLMHPRFAQAASTTNVDASKAQYLILSTSLGGCPLNANVPGTYIPGIDHPPQPSMAPVNLALPNGNYPAATPWSTLPPEVLSHCCFFHHSTETEIHTDVQKVLQVGGLLPEREMLLSVLSKQLAPALGTIQAQPVTIGARGAGEGIFYEGVPQPLLSPTAVAAMLKADSSPLHRLEAVRDQDLNRLNALFRTTGNKAQLAFLDQYAQSQSDARKISDNLLNMLATIKNDGQNAQMICALVLIQMKVTPVVVVHVDFGNDNHADTDLSYEASSTQTGVRTLVELTTQLKDANLSDKVTFAAMNVFGRTLKRNKVGGRDHLASHHCTVMIGPSVQGGVIGGLAPNDEDFTALPIDSKSGQGQSGGDISRPDSLASVAKTLGVGVGVNQAFMDQTLGVGKVVHPALLGT